jgi:hypothetical protein
MNPADVEFPYPFISGPWKLFTLLNTTNSRPGSSARSGSRAILFHQIPERPRLITLPSMLVSGLPLAG